MTTLEKYFSQSYDKLVSGDFSIEKLESQDNAMERNSKAYIDFIKSYPEEVDKEALLRFIIIQLDYYTFSNIGGVFITDSDYDVAVSLAKKMGIDVPTTSTFQPSTKSWQLKEHSCPQMVGSVEKVFDIDEVVDFISDELAKTFGSTEIVFAPKFDGVGICIEYDPETVSFVSALTRKDGKYGQELIKVIKQCDNMQEVLYEAGTIFGTNKGFIKAEIVMSQSNFEKLNEVKHYANRRNATSGIVNTPTNLEYAKYLTIKPIAYAHIQSRNWKYFYRPIGCEVITNNDFQLEPKRMVKKNIERILNDTHNTEFEFRTDGVVIFLDNIHMNYENIMSHAVAFKTNSKVGITQIEYPYLSIGRTGKVTPMIKVRPCDVNETVVTDISLSNFAKVEALGLHEHDTIMIESSGDVIPMVKKVVARGDIEELQYKLECPCCGKRLTRVQGTGKGIAEFICENPKCSRIVVGKIANFFDKIGANGISDALIMDVYDKLNMSSIGEFLNTSKYRHKLAELDGWGITSADNFCDEIERLKIKTLTRGELIGAMGIPLISTKKCKSLFAEVDFDEFMYYVKKNDIDSCENLLFEVKGLARKSIDTIIEFFDKNFEDIIDICDSFTNIIKDSKAGPNIVFTGFRDSNAADRLESEGIDVSDNINGNTIAVISANMRSGKTQRAVALGIPVYDAYNLDAAIDKILSLR